MTARRLVLVCAATLLAAMPSAALAHPLIDDARGLLDQGAFADVVSRLARAEAEGPLTRTELLLLLELRALAFHALQQTLDRDRALASLASIDPAHAFDPAAPPEIVDRFQEIAARSPEPLGVVVEVQRAPTTATVLATATRADTGLVRQIEVSARPEGGRWVTGTDRVSLELGTEETVEYFANLIGPGGALVAQSGDATAPLRDGEEESSGAGWWILGISLGVAVVAASVVLAIVLLSDDGVQLSPPILR